MSFSLPELQALFAPRFRLVRELGGGSMAAVYLAEDTRHARPVALKLLRPDYAATLAAERFLREIEIAARLQHPHIVPLLDSGEVRGHLYLVLPFIEGESLRLRLVREGPLPPGDVVRILIDVADALGYAHGKGIIHRDIKPDNILMSGRHALVTDFGVAKAVSAATLAPRDLTIGVALGTPAYMAPEQATAAPDLDQRVDIYALGVVGYELLTGRPPFERNSAQAILTAHVMETPPPVRAVRADVPSVLGEIIDRCLAKRPEDRWQSAEELLGQLDLIATPTGGSTPAAMRPLPAPRRRWWPVVAIVGALAAGTFLLARPKPPVTIGMSGVQRQLTFTGQVSGAAISPDGQFLALVTDSGGRSILMVQDVRGGQPIELSRALRFDFPTWSGDGSEVRAFAFDRAHATLRRVPRLGGAARDLEVPLWSVLSPAGDRLATLRQAGPSLVIRTVATGDSAVVPLDGGWWHSVPAWSADGQWLAWSSNRQSGSGPNRLTTLSLATLAPIVALEDTVQLGAPGWSSDGQALFYMRGRDRVVNLMRLPLDQRRSRALPPELIRAGITAGLPQTYISFQPPPSLSNDGSLLVYMQQQEWSNLGIAPLGEPMATARIQRLTEGTAVWEGARFSPDAKRVAVERSETDGFSLQVLSLDGQPPRELGRTSGVGGLTWSPAADVIVAATVERDSGRGLHLYALDGSRSTSLAQGLVGDTPEYADDSTLLVPRLGNGPLLEVDTRSGKVRPAPWVDSVGYMFFPRRSPDGDRVAIAWNRRGDQRLWVLSRTPGVAPIPIAEGLFNPAAWSGDGKVLYLVSAGFLADSSRVVAARADGSGTRSLGVYPPSAEPIDVTPDGKRVLLVLHQRRGDAWAIRFSPRP